MNRRINKKSQTSSRRRSGSLSGLLLILKKIPTCVGITVVGIGITLLLSIPAQAEDKDKYELCKLLPHHVPANDVAYQAGIDVDGKAVVPADLNSASMQEALDVVRVPLNVDLAQNVVALQNQGIQLEAPLGMLDIYQDGRVLYNGQDWTAPVQILCGQSHKIVTEEIVVVEEEIKIPVVPEAPLMEEVEEIAKPLLDKLPVTDDLDMPAVAAPMVKEISLPKVSQPATPIKPLIGTPKGSRKIKILDMMQ